MKVRINKNGEKYYLDENNTTWQKEDDLGNYKHGAFRKNKNGIFKKSGNCWNRIQIEKIDWAKIVDSVAKPIQKEFGILEKKFDEECKKLKLKYTDEKNTLWEKKYAKKAMAIHKKFDKKIFSLWKKYFESDNTTKPGYKII